MTDTEKDTLCARIDELCAENERLRKAKDTMRGDAFEIGAMLVKARDENEKLRELVSELYQCSRQEGCDHCGYKDGCSMFDRMAQLGIEVR